MARRRRRSRRTVRLRRWLIEHRFKTAHALLGLILLAIGGSLMWPGGGAVPVDYRNLWQRSLHDGSPSHTSKEIDGIGQLARIGVAVSAKLHLASSPPRIRGKIEPRLRQVAASMPAIGMPDQEFVDGLEAKLSHGPSDEAKQMAAATEDTASQPDVAAHVPSDPLLSIDGHTPTWLRNAVAVPRASGRDIAVVIDDLGLNRRGTAALIHLRGPLTLAFLPYASALTQQTRAARAAGHELMLHLPMEPVGRDWPGPNALLTSLTPADLLSRLRANLRSFRGFVGVNNHMGSLLTTDAERMMLVMAELRRHDLLFLDSRTTPASVASREARRMGVPTAVRDVFIDNELDLNYVLRQLALAERIAERRGFAVAIGHPHEVTITALGRWLPTLNERGFQLVPISAIASRNACADGMMPVADGCQPYLAAQQNQTVVVQ